jgi:hypothetical protein
MLAMIPLSYATIAARRRARIAFGWPLIAGAVAMVANGLSRHVHFALILLAAWSLAFVAALVARMILSRRMPAAAPSLALPLIGLCLVLPLTLHFAVGSLAGWGAKEFDDWVDLSLVVTGPAHLAIAGLCAYRARELTTPPRVAIRTLTIYGWTIGVSCVPFGLLWMIPPALVAVTALGLVPFIYAMQTIAERERAPAGDLMPRAVASV